MASENRTAHEKAIRINIEGKRLGTFAEIGAGQEVARWFFHSGRASATVAKSISAYDMAISDGLYGPTEHYVSRPRLEAMLDREYAELVERLGTSKGEGQRFFVYADTVATHGSRRRGDHGGHGWLGVRFQTQVGGAPSQIIAHVEMLDGHTADQQEAVGMVGVNLLFGAFYHQEDPGALIGTLLDDLGRERLEVDMIKFSGPGFEGVDNRLMSLQLVEQGLTDVAMFTAAGEVVQSSEILSRKPVLMVRGSFRPMTKVVRDAIERAREQLREDGKKIDGAAVVTEMTLHNLMNGQSIDHQDFLARVDLLGALGYLVMISNYTTYDRVTQYLRSYTSEPVAMVVGIPILRQILDDKYYEDFSGGLLEGLGRLFSGPVKLLVYPTVDDAGRIITSDTLELPGDRKNLYAYLTGNGFIQPIRKYEPANLHIRSADVLAKLQAGDPAWESMTPPEAVRLIQAKGLFGYRGDARVAAD